MSKHLKSGTIIVGCMFVYKFKKGGTNMYVNAIEKVTEYTRPFLSISRAYGADVVEPSCATIIIVNSEGWVLTCKHVAQQIKAAQDINNKYAQFKNEVKALSTGDKHYKSKLRALEKKYGYVKGKVVVQLKNQISVVDTCTGAEYFFHPEYDVALIRIDGFSKVLCNQFPVFAKDSSVLKQGKSLCRLGYPYPEFSNFKYDAAKDDIEWTNAGRATTPLFPIDGILTRHVIGNGGRLFAVEMSTPGLRGQSGGPLFDTNGVVYGMQSSTLTLPLGFDQENREIKVNGVSKKVNDYSFIHLGRCIHIDIIKEFMDAHGVKYQVG
jgi:hypothetical protein